MTDCPFLNQTPQNSDDTDQNPDAQPLTSPELDGKATNAADHLYQHSISSHCKKQDKKKPIIVKLTKIYVEKSFRLAAHVSLFNIK
jgi:hypothetical protein